LPQVGRGQHKRQAIAKIIRILRRKDNADKRVLRRIGHIFNALALIVIKNIRGLAKFAVNRIVI
jgi:hypothetical protein